MTDRHMWLRKALADKGLSGADVARSWGVHDSVVVRFTKTGEPRITAFRVLQLCKLLNMDRPELLARLGERPVHFAELSDQPISLVAAFVQAIGMDVIDVLERLEKPKRRKSDKRVPVTTTAPVVDDDDEYGGW
jgi:DNA-binding Xre family transcriptional regulator